jgi:hypothetical protein
MNDWSLEWWGTATQLDDWRRAVLFIISSRWRDESPWGFGTVLDVPRTWTGWCRKEETRRRYGVSRCQKFIFTVFARVRISIARALSDVFDSDTWTSSFFIQLSRTRAIISYITCRNDKLLSVGNFMYTQARAMRCEFRRSTRTVKGKRVGLRVMYIRGLWTRKCNSLWGHGKSLESLDFFYLDSCFQKSLVFTSLKSWISWLRSSRWSYILTACENLKSEVYLAVKFLHKTIPRIKNYSILIKYIWL